MERGVEWWTVCDEEAVSTPLTVSHVVRHNRAPRLRYGDLNNILQSCDEKQLVVPPEVLLSFCVQVADGMAFVAGQGYVHLDLAARNLLLGSLNQVKVADFGLANSMGENGKFELTQGGKLPMKWMSIESMDRRIFSEASDVWAYGITVWELFSYGATPYIGIKNLELQEMIRDGLRLDEPAAAVEGMHDYCVEHLWAANPTMRPAFTSVEKKFKEFASRFPTSSGDLGKQLAMFDPKAVVKTLKRRPMWYVYCFASPETRQEEYRVHPCFCGFPRTHAHHHRGKSTRRFHGTTSQADGDAIVLAGEQGDFIVRRADAKNYSLVVKDGDTVATFEIVEGDNHNFVLNQKEYGSLDEMIADIKMHPLQGAEGPLKLHKARKAKKSCRIRALDDDKQITQEQGADNALAPASYDPTTDTGWYVGKVRKSAAEDAIIAGRPGDFLVRSKKDGTKHYLVLHDGPACITYVIKVKADGSHTLGKLSALSLEALVAKVMGQSFPGKCQPLVRVMQPADVDGGRSMSRATSESGLSESSAPTSRAGSPLLDNTFAGFGDDSVADPPQGFAEDVDDVAANGFEESAADTIDGFGDSAGALTNDTIPDKKDGTVSRDDSFGNTDI